MPAAALRVPHHKMVRPCILDSALSLPGVPQSRLISSLHPCRRGPSAPCSQCQCWPLLLMEPVKNLHQRSSALQRLPQHLPSGMPAAPFLRGLSCHTAPLTAQLLPRAGWGLVSRRLKMSVLATSTGHCEMEGASRLWGGSPPVVGRPSWATLAT